MTILITGATGLVGPRLLSRLAAADIDWPRQTSSAAPLSGTERTCLSASNAPKATFSTRTHCLPLWRA